MLNDYKSLADEDLDKKIADVQNKMNLAFRMGQTKVIDQLEFRLEELKLELSERLEKERFDIINKRTPDSLIIGEDDGKSEDTDSNSN
ncbi:MAG: hypothetical protein CBB97_02415 [Candidatus Endolissoclinum sp. TMED37]|nr:MAG: hypothetical protein CBB97_02415 [Candidatus Endolissoclinum sp. TMED37]|tara:strand:- start:924 stop:1187 length:264 start_codon:yes stop_codon:yes gene_type:complete